MNSKWYYIKFDRQLPRKQKRAEETRCAYTWCFTIRLIKMCIVAYRRQVCPAGPTCSAYLIRKTSKIIFCQLEFFSYQTFSLNFKVQLYWFHTVGIQLLYISGRCEQFGCECNQLDFEHKKVRRVHARHFSWVLLRLE